MAAPSQPARRRSREATRRRILDAAERLAVHAGVGALGVNAVAQRAGVDKVLIYRYFGGGDQLLAALAAERAPLPALADSCRGHATLDAALRAVLRAELTHLSGNALARRLAEWEFSGPDDFRAARTIARATAWAQVVAELRARFVPPPFLDLEALVTVLSGAMRMSVLSAGGFASGAEGTVAAPLPRDRAERIVDVIVRTLAGSRDA